MEGKYLYLGPVVGIRETFHSCLHIQLSKTTVRSLQLHIFYIITRALLRLVRPMHLLSH